MLRTLFRNSLFNISMKNWENKIRKTIFDVHDVHIWYLKIMAKGITQTVIIPAFICKCGQFHGLLIWFVIIVSIFYPFTRYYISTINLIKVNYISTINEDWVIIHIVKYVFRFSQKRNFTHRICILELHISMITCIYLL